jgi:hypothetical protein
MLLAGVAGYVALGLCSLHPALFALGGLIAYGPGWGWTAVLIIAILRLFQDRPGVATFLIQFCGSLGAMIGPVVFSQLTGATSFRTAWLSLSALTLTSVVLILAARRVVIRERAALGAAGLQPATAAG